MLADESVPILNKLRSVVFFERDNVHARFRIIHATFREYLSRSDEVYHVDAGPVHARLAEDCTRVLRVFVTEQWKGSSGTSILIRLLSEELPQATDFPHVRYATDFIDHHYEQGTDSPTDEQKKQVVGGDFIPPLVSIPQFAFYPKPDHMWTMMSAVVKDLRSYPLPQGLLDAWDALCTGKWSQTVGRTHGLSA